MRTSGDVLLLSLKTWLLYGMFRVTPQDSIPSVFFGDPGTESLKTPWGALDEGVWCSA